MQAKPGAEPDGTWQKGFNPLRQQQGVAEPGFRTKELIKKHGIEVILKAMDDPKFLAETFSSFDGMLIMGVANALKGNGEERERMLNRMFGKVPDKQINLNLNIEADPDKLSEKASTMLASLAGLDEDNSDLIED